MDNGFEFLFLLFKFGFFYFTVFVMLFGYYSVK